MTPRFYKYFNLLKRSLDAFNQRCNCQQTTVNITFTQSLGTKNSNDDPSLWVANFESNVFDKIRFGGKFDRVVNLIENHIDPIIDQTLEASIANADDWFKDNPDIKNTLFVLFNELSELREEVL